MDLKNDVFRWWYNKDQFERKKTQRNALIGAAVISILVYIQVNKYNKAESNTQASTNQQVSEIALTEADSALLLEQDIAASARQAVQAEVGNIDSKVADAIKLHLGATPIPAQPQPPVTVEVPAKTASLQQPVQPVRQDFSHLQLPDGVTIPSPQASIGAQYDYNSSQQADIDIQAEYAPPVWVFKGGIDSSGATAADYGAKPQATTDKVKEIELPVGFMKARLLVGINARSGEFGLNNPQQVVFHVSAPAQLPNRIKMDLAGCFVVANVHGDLSAQRIEALPVSMNCLTNNGKFKIESDSLKGFVQDGDGKRGLDARVVSKARHLLAGSLFANTVTGFGEVVAAQGVTQSVSPIGTVNTISNDELAKSAGAKGIAGGFKDLGDYLLDLARQMQPTLEQGAGKPVLVWIAETAVLRIEELKK